MKALVYTGPKQLDYRDVPDPVAQGTDALGSAARTCTPFSGTIRAVLRR